jgi:hypothetical protein
MYFAILICVISSKFMFCFRKHVSSVKVIDYVFFLDLCYVLKNMSKLIPLIHLRLTFILRGEIILCFKNITY